MKTTLRFGVSTLLAGALCSLTACEKEQLTGLPNTEQNQISSTLHFASPDALKLAVTQLSKGKDKIKGLDAIRSSGLATAEHNFTSLAQHRIELHTGVIQNHLCRNTSEQKQSILLIFSS